MTCNSEFSFAKCKRLSSHGGHTGGWYLVEKVEPVGNGQVNSDCR